MKNTYPQPTTHSNMSDIGENSPAFHDSEMFTESSTELRHLTLPDAFKIGIAISYIKESGKNGYRIGQEDEDYILGALSTV